MLSEKVSAEICENIGGFDMYVTSEVLSGSGISSSAAFENLFPPQSTVTITARLVRLK